MGKNVRKTALRATRSIGLIALAGFALAGAGCRCASMPPTNLMAPVDAPREGAKVTLPPYKIEPPDILQIEAVVLKYNEELRAVVKTEPPVALWPQPVTGPFLVKPDGTVELGVYGSTQVTGLTIAEARESIQGFLAYVTGLKPQQIAVAVDVVQHNSK